MKRIIIAIDGPSGAGKTTTAKLVSKKLNFNYIDSGSAYRAVCYLALSKNIDLYNQDTIMRLFEHNDIILNNGSILFCGSDITGNLRDIDVSSNVSTISALPKIREYVTGLIRSQAKEKGIVVEGRDIGSIVFKETPFKFFLTAELSIRIQRRDGEEIEKRDNKDTTRALAPLTRPENSLLIRTDEISPDVCAERIIEKVRFQNKRNFFYSSVGTSFYLLFKLYFRLSITGCENIPKSSPLIVASNHLSYLDPPIISVAFLKRELFYFAKKELFFPIFGWLIKKLNALPADRGGFNKETIKMIIRVLENGGACLIFPEGTRKREQRRGRREEGRPEPGVGFIAHLANKTIKTPIIPVKIIGTDKALGVGDFFIKPRKIKVIIGKPIDPEILNLRDYQKTADIVMEKIREL